LGSGILGDGLVLVAIGLGIGLSLAVLASTMIARLLFEVAPTDPKTFAYATILLLLVGGVSVCIPAWRALRVDVAATLRSAE
jgi:ABC-type antimicrobial peptide transport system permease subunit